MPEMGGMLRYGIPEYRLPKAILQKEIDVIRNIGVEFRNNAPVALGDLREDYDAVIIAAGAWASSPLRCKGEELAIDGIKFLHELPSVCGKTVAVVGGGNTAMDACRTAVRLGAERVYNIYRRTRAEMPADAREVTEAEEEGVIFKFLVNPIEITGSGAPASLRLRIMELGEPDASGRRAPVETDREESLAVDIVISAIGQKLNPKGFGGVELTEWGTIKADEAAFCTNLQGVWAIGDAVNDGAGIAVSAIGHARKAAEAVHAYLSGHTAPDTPLYFSKTEKTPADFSDEPKKPRISPPLRPPAERRNDFDEISTVFTEEQARREAQRCLGCGCPDYKKCKLIEYANSYGATPERFGSLPSSPRSGGNAGTALPGITQTPEKCILCGLCVRFCEEEVDAGLLGFVGRGYGTAVRAEGDVNPCADCGKCAELCPTGALHKS
jgi:formate dehydrogenase major subunit